MASTTNTSYNSAFTGEQVDASVSNAPVGLTAAQLVNPSSTILNYNSSKIIIVTQASSAEAAKRFTVGSLWHVVGGSIQPLGEGEESILGIAFADVSTNGSSTTKITKSDVKTSGINLKVNELILSKSSDIYRVTEVRDTKYIVEFCQNIKGEPGAPGEEGRGGVRWTVGQSLSAVGGTNTVVVYWYDTYWPQEEPRVGDLYLIAETYPQTGIGFLFAQGDVYEVAAIETNRAIMQKKTNIKGEPGVKGADGLNGTQILYANTPTSSSTTTISYNTLQADLHAPAVGDMIISTSGDVFIITGQEVPADVSSLTSLTGTEWKLAENLDIDSAIESGYLTETYHLDFISDTGDILTTMKFSKRNGVVTLSYDDEIKYGKFDGDASVNSGAVSTSLIGDMNNDGQVDSDDAIYLLRHTLFPSQYPIDKFADFNDDGKVTSDDAVYLLRHTLFPEKYPLDGDKSGVSNSDWENQKDRTIFISGGASYQSPLLLPWMKNSHNATLLGTSATVRFCMNIGAGGGLPPVTPADAGKFLVVDSSGNWVAMTMQEWQGGNY